jgi:hypothetical protein
MENLAIHKGTQKLPYTPPALVEYGSVRDITQEASILGAIVSVVAVLV